MILFFDIDGTLLNYQGRMGNACEELKSRVDYVTDSVDQHGLWKAMKYWKLI